MSQPSLIHSLLHLNKATQQEILGINMKNMIIITFAMLTASVYAASTPKIYSREFAEAHPDIIKRCCAATACKAPLPGSCHDCCY